MNSGQTHFNRARRRTPRLSILPPTPGYRQPRGCIRRLGRSFFRRKVLLLDVSDSKSILRPVDLERLTRFKKLTEVQDYICKFTRQSRRELECFSFPEGHADRKRLWDLGDDMIFNRIVSWGFGEGRGRGEGRTLRIRGERG